MGMRRAGRDEMSDDQTTQRNPKEQGPRPEYPAQDLEHPGLEAEMELPPDYG